MAEPTGGQLGLIRMGRMAKLSASTLESCCVEWGLYDEDGIS